MGRDKAFLEIDGAPLWQRQLRILRELGPFEVFIAGTARSEWIKAGVEIVFDPPNDVGPLGGLVAALRRCTTPLLLALAVDLPKMTSEFLRRLLPLCSEEKGVILKRGKRFEPLAAFYPVACLPLAENLLRSKHYSLQELAARVLEERLVIEKRIPRKDIPLFFNLNTPDDFIALRKNRLRRPTPGIC